MEITTKTTYEVNGKEFETMQEALLYREVMLHPDYTPEQKEVIFDFLTSGGISNYILTYTKFFQEEFNK